MNGKCLEDDFAEAKKELNQKIDIELLRESLRIMGWQPTMIEFIVTAVEEQKS